MTQTEKFIDRLTRLKEGHKEAQLSLLRRSAGQTLDAGLPVFDLFTGLWWPLRAESPKTPQRWCAWLTAKLYGTFPFPVSDRSLATAVGQLEPKVVRSGIIWDTKDRDRFRARFDGVLVCAGRDLLLEPHLRWCLRQIAGQSPQSRGVNWAGMLDDLWRWDRPFNQANQDDHRRIRVHADLHHCAIQHPTVQEVWACEYLDPGLTTLPDPNKGADHGERAQV